VAADDEIIRAYEEELGPGPAPRSNRGFWVIVVTFALGGIFLIVEIFANRPLAESIGHAQQTLREAEAAAGLVRDRQGGYAGADADGLSDVLPGLTFRPADAPSFGNEVVSVSASDTVWAAAVQARPGACFYLRLEVGSDPAYGVGTACTGEDALDADDTRW
jgi:hypothetical protein